MRLVVAILMLLLPSTIFAEEHVCSLLHVSKFDANRPDQTEVKMADDFNEHEKFTMFNLPKYFVLERNNLANLVEILRTDNALSNAEFNDKNTKLSFSYKSKPDERGWYLTVAYDFHFRFDLDREQDLLITKVEKDYVRNKVNITFYSYRWACIPKVSVFSP